MKTSPKKIAIVSDAIYPFNKGGKEKRIYDITNRLAADGHDVTIYCMKWWKEPHTEIVQNGVKFHAISAYHPLYSGERRSISEAVFFAFSCLKLLGKQFDIIEVDHMPHIALFTMKIVCVLKGKKMIATWHEVWGLAYWKSYIGGILGTIGYLVEKTSSRLPDAIISVSDHTTKNLNEMLGVTHPIFTIPNGLDIGLIANYPPAKKGADVLFAGRLLAHKHVDLLIRAMSLVIEKYPGATLWIIGEGPERASLEELVKSSHLEKNVSFLGFLQEQNDLYGIMKASKLFVLPSTREGFGIVVVEANACGIPVVTIDDKQNAAKELISEGQNGAIVPLDIKSLSIAIESFLIKEKEPELYRSFAKPFDWGAITEKLQKAYLS